MEIIGTKAWPGYKRHCAQSSTQAATLAQAAVVQWSSRTLYRAPTALPSSAIAKRERAEPGQQCFLDRCVLGASDIQPRAACLLLAFVSSKS